MIKLLIGEVKRLFSTKKNGGKLVHCMTDRLHYYKQFLLALSIVLLLGYSQFRLHFLCQEAEKIDAKILTNFCWINGTRTINLKDEPSFKPKQIANPYSRFTNGQRQIQINMTKATQAESETLIPYPIKRLIPHVGIQFKLNDSRYEVIDHNYMRSLWALLILMAFCSYLAQRSWSSIFKQDVLKALLKLPGHEELQMVKRAQEINSFDKLIKLPNDDSDKRRKELARLEEMFVGFKLKEPFDLIVGFDNNEYNHLLDYYPNQLIYLLLAKKFGKIQTKILNIINNKYNGDRFCKEKIKKTAFRDNIKNLNLRYKLFFYSFKSTLLTSMQFLLPWLVIGNKYLLYGWLYATSWFNYFVKQLQEPTLSTNSIDYELSARIWPTVVMCEYKQFGLHGTDVVTTQCSVPINEICAKLFVVLWWFIVCNLVIEIYCLLLNTISLIASLFGSNKFLKFLLLPKGARMAAEQVALFRHRHSILLSKLLKENNLHRPASSSYSSASSTITERDDINNNNDDDCSPLEQNQHTLPKEKIKTKENGANSYSIDEKKELPNNNTRKHNNIDINNNFNWFTRNILSMDRQRNSNLIKKSNPPVRNNNNHKEQHVFYISQTDSAMIYNNNYDETKEFIDVVDINIYYYFYLLYLRFDNSSKKTRQVIIMTRDALDRYMENLKRITHSDCLKNLQ